jgi:hypothetical protein
MAAYAYTDFGGPMQQNVKILAILHIVFGGLGVLAALICLAVFGGIAGLVHWTDTSDQGAVGSAVVGLVGAIVVIVVLVISLPELIAGIGLLSFQPWARILTIVLSVLELPGFPFHTALGIFGLWVLLSTEGTALFNRPSPIRV